MAPKSIPVPQGPDMGELQGRVRQLEDELKKKSDSADTTRAITIAQGSPLGKIILTADGASS